MRPANRALLTAIIHIRFPSFGYGPGGESVIDLPVLFSSYLAFQTLPQNVLAYGAYLQIGCVSAVPDFITHISSIVDETPAVFTWILAVSVEDRF